VSVVNTPSLDQLLAAPETVATLDAEGRSRVMAACASLLAMMSAVILPESVRRDEDPVRTARDVAARTGLSKAFVYELMRTKQMPRIKVGNRVGIRESQLIAWIEKRERDGFDPSGKAAA